MAPTHRGEVLALKNLLKIVKNIGYPNILVEGSCCADSGHTQAKISSLETPHGLERSKTMPSRMTMLICVARSSLEKPINTSQEDQSGRSTVGLP